jgi:serine/threonine protein kinase
MPVQIGRYEVDREIGRGGMAVVYLARQLDLDRAVALKELAGLHAHDATHISRFLREARLAGSLNHPNIVTVYEYFEDGGVPYMAMEYLPRGSLRPLVGTLSLEQALVALDGVLCGLAHAHEHGIVHRDLKPENVMRSEAGVKIADFGIAKAQGEAASNLTPAGEFVGAPAYVSPEQVLGKEATAASDLYSVGVVAFELLTGKVPFADETSGAALLVRKVQERPPRLRALRPELDRALATWVEALLERDPARRPGDAAAVQRSLEDIAEGLAGPRWRSEHGLPAAEPGPSSSVAVAPTPHRFVGVGALEQHAPPRMLALRALTRPASLAVLVVLAVLGAAIAPWLVGVAAAAYVALAAITFFDEAEAVAAAGGRR